MQENQDEIGTTLGEVLEEGSNYNEGPLHEQVDFIFLTKFHVDFTTLPIQRIMGLLRQLRIEYEVMNTKFPRK